MTLEIVGRQEELASVRAFIDGAGKGLASVVLEGDPGIGKSTLWLAGVEYARERRLCVVSSRPAEAERHLAYAGLDDLFADVLGDVLPDLALPRRRALEVALLLKESGDDGSVNQRAVAVAVRDALQRLSERAPVLIAIDDVQWLDPSSSSALVFALRRLEASRVLLLVARRVTGAEDRSQFERTLFADPASRVSVGPLSAGALHQLLRDRLGRSFPRQTLLRIHERSGDNPFFALELARVVDPNVVAFAPLPVPETLDELVRVRLGGLPAATLDALAAAIGTPSESLLERAGVAMEILEPATAAHVIERENGTLRFTHPLLSSAPVVRARHLALANDAPDADVACVIEDAERLAADRGAAAIAGELAEQALRLTPAA